MTTPTVIRCSVDFYDGNDPVFGDIFSGEKTWFVECFDNGPGRRVASVPDWTSADTERLEKGETLNWSLRWDFGMLRRSCPESSLDVPPEAFVSVALQKVEPDESEEVDEKLLASLFGGEIKDKPLPLKSGTIYLATEVLPRDGKPGRVDINREHLHADASPPYCELGGGGGCPFVDYVPEGWDGSAFDAYEIPDPEYPDSPEEWDIGPCPSGVQPTLRVWRATKEEYDAQVARERAAREGNCVSTPVL